MANFGDGWEYHVAESTALPSAVDRCGACAIALQLERAPYGRDEDGPFFQHLAPKHKFSFEMDTVLYGGDVMYCEPVLPVERRAASYRSFNTDLQTVGAHHNDVALDRGWSYLDLVRLSWHAWRHGCITNAFLLEMDELAIQINYRVASIEVRVVFSPPSFRSRF